MARTCSGAPVLVLCAEHQLRSSLAELLIADGRPVMFGGLLGGASRPGLVIAACDSWPSGWSEATLRSTFARVPCVMLSGSPLAGDFAVTKLARGYFVRLPAMPGEILSLVAELSAA